MLGFFSFRSNIIVHIIGLFGGGGGADNAGGGGGSGYLSPTLSCTYPFPLVPGTYPAAGFFPTPSGGGAIPPNPQTTSPQRGMINKLVKHNLFHTSLPFL